ncbi:MAG: hypothetical protein J5950_02155 [Clostridia bacterium]|nr:hypothetical protein [Clostridia bacterium]
MGEMVMKNMFDRNNFVLSGLDEKQKKTSLFVTLGVALFFILSAFTFMNFLYCLSDCIGSIVCASADVALRDALRSMPVFLTFFITLSGLMIAHTFYRNENAEMLRKKAKKHAVIGIVIGTILIVYVIVMRIAGKYLSLVEGAPSPLYPLDSVLYALLIIALEVLILVYFKKKAENGAYNGPSRAPLQKKGRFVRSFFRTFWMLIALYGFCGFFYSIFIVDFKNGYVAYSLAMMLVSLIAFLSLAVWELYYNNLTEEKRKEVTLPLAIISLAVSVAATIFYFIALKGNLDGPSNVGFGILPIAFSASVNFATLLVVALPLIVSITALIRGLYRKGKAKK